MDPLTIVGITVMIACITAMIYILKPTGTVLASKYEYDIAERESRIKALKNINGTLETINSNNKLIVEVLKEDILDHIKEKERLNAEIGKLRTEVIHLEKKILENESLLCSGCQTRIERVKK